jgi:DNA-binding transcriptional LysR family regulator
MRLELDWLRSWVAVVETGGFARAGDLIHLSQPRVSVHVAQLESELGYALLDRAYRPVELTDDGRRFLPHARAVLASVDSALADISYSLATDRTRLTIASYPSASSKYLPGLLRRVGSAHPDHSIAVIDSDIRGIEECLFQRRADIAIRPLAPAPKDPRLSVSPIWREDFAVLVPNGHPLLECDSVTLDTLLAFRLISIGSPKDPVGLGDELSAVLASIGLTHEDGLVVHEPSTLAALARAGEGVGVINQLAGSIVRMDGLKQVPLRDRRMYRDVGVWWRNDLPISAGARAVLEAVPHAPIPAHTIPSGVVTEAIAS